MKEKSKLKRYRDPEKQMKYIDDYNKDNYRSFTFRLHKDRDKEIISDIDNRKNSLASMIRNWYKKAKK